MTLGELIDWISDLPVQTLTKELKAEIIAAIKVTDL